MQAIMETLFDIVYLTLVITVGIRMMIKGRKEKQYFLFGVMAVILGAGDAFHLIPRAYAHARLVWKTLLQRLELENWLLQSL